MARPPRVPPTPGNGKLPPAPALQLPPPVKLARFVYPQFQFQVGGNDLTPGLAIEFDGNEPTVIVFTLPNGEEHCFPMAENARRALVAALTGGIEIAKPGSML
jgi:hypothetical protein